MKKLYVLSSIFIFLFSVQSVFSQSGTKPSSGNSVAELINSPVPDPQVSEVARNLDLARKNNDETSQRYWESKLNELTKPQIIGELPNSMLIGKTVNIPVSNPEKVLNLTTVASGIGNGGHSVSRECVSGNIYAAIDVYGNAGSDTLKVFRSTDNGLHFTQIYTLTSGTLFKINFNQLDVEAVSKGDSTYAFIGMSYVIGGVNNSVIVRVRQDGNMFSVVGYAGSAVNRYTNMRITSDNARFTNQAYIYAAVTLDSLVSGARNLRSKMFRITNPFAVTMIATVGYQANPNGNYGYLVLGTSPDSATFQSDIAYVNNAGDSSCVYTLTVVRGVPSSFGGGSWLAYTRSNDFGATTPIIFTNTSDTKLKENPRIAATGFHNNSLMTVTRRLFGGGDWDPYYYYSGNINAPTPTYTSDYVESTTDTTYGVSVCAMYKGNGSYLFAFNNYYHSGSKGNVFIRGANNTSFGFITQSNPVAGSGPGFYGYPDAAFRNVSGDSCFVMWSGPTGIDAFVTGGCSGTFVGIGNNSSDIKDFRLDQNYPNPFNPTTNISYNIPYSGLVKIVVYDVLGSEVATVLNENKVAGYYSSSFDGKNLASGAYYYKITFTSTDNNSFSQTKKMMLIK